MSDLQKRLEESEFRNLKAIERAREEERAIMRVERRVCLVPPLEVNLCA